ncbi:hypothetical protein BDV97DRAFT_374453 [Delphinella strobiligena]|nr:hypothetical protein BDV97DRAFT_374453 [Delphinella strobiligena]
MPLPTIAPPLINSANPWCSSQEDLQNLYECPSTGAVTTRTSVLKGFNHDPAVNQHTFFDPQNHAVAPQGSSDYTIEDSKRGSLNTLGYSPIPLAGYLDFISAITSKSGVGSKEKPFIISVTGSPAEILECYKMITAHQRELGKTLCMEINLSCPNIPLKPPPAYSGSALLEYLEILQSHPEHAVPIGIKTSPYTYHNQFATLVDTLLSASKLGCGCCPIDFITATNTLGSCLLLDSCGDAALASASGEGIGGLAGAPLHPLALGNVKTIRIMLDKHDVLRSIDIIGVGGVGDSAGFERMKSVGAKVVGIGTALGREGVQVFGRIAGD